MAFTNLGYDGSINEVQEAIRTPHMGVSTPIVIGPSDFKVTSNISADRTVNIAAGAAWGAGVYTTSDSVQSVQLGIVASSNRWDAVVLRRDWATNLSQLAVVQHSVLNSKTLPSAVQKNPGASYDQVLALVQVTAGKTVPTAILDLRCWASKVISCADLLAIPTPALGMQVQIGTARYSRVLDANGNPAWLSAGKITTVQSGSATAATGWTVGSPMVCRYRQVGGLVCWEVQARRTGAALRFGPDGGIGDTTVLTLNGPRPDSNQFIQFQTVGGAAPTSTSGLAAWGYVLTDGRVVIESGLPNNYIIQRTGASDSSIRSIFSFMKES